MNDFNIEIKITKTKNQKMDNNKFKEFTKVSNKLLKLKSKKATIESNLEKLLKDIEVLEEDLKEILNIE